MKRLIFFALWAAAVALAGCSKKEVASTEAKKPRNIELYYYKQENQEGLRNIITAFEQDNPDIHVNFFIIPNDADATLSVRASQNKLPTLLQLQTYARVNDYASKGYLRDLTGIDALKQVQEAATAGIYYKDKIYAIPLDFAGIGIIYNKDIFQKYRISAPRTFQELVKVCNELKQQDIVPFAGLLKENWSVGQFLILVHTSLLADKANASSHAELNQYYADFVTKMNNGETTYGDAINKKRLFEILDFYRENMNDNASDMAGGDQQRSFANGESAMMVQGLWSYVDALKLNPNLNVDFIPFPVFDDPEKNKIYADVGTTFAVSSQATEQEQLDAVTFLNWLSTDKGKDLWVREYRITHSFKGGNFEVLGTPYIDLMRMVEKEGAYPWMSHRYPPIVYEDGCKNAAQQYLLQKIDMNEALDLIDKSWQGAVSRGE